MIQLEMGKINKALYDIALDILYTIRKNCSKSVDMYGNPFVPYSDAYALWKTEYQSKGNMTDANIERGSRVNLKLKGAMLESIMIKKEPQKNIIFIPLKDRAIIAYRHHTGSGVPRRPFFGVSAENEKKIVDRHMKKTNILSVK